MSESRSGGHGAHAPRGLDAARSSQHSGRFGRLFRTLPPLRMQPEDPLGLAEEDLAHLASLMTDATEPGQQEWGVTAGEPMQGASGNSSIPAGYTYVGQFVDHDITFDPVSELQGRSDPDALQNFRTPALDLDSVYGRGPHDAPFLYGFVEDPDAPTNPDGAKLYVARHYEDVEEPDLPRVHPRGAGSDRSGRAVMGDPRNDENIIVSQLHLGVMRFHNRVVDAVRERREAAGLPEAPAHEIFEQARTVVTHHYQWAVLCDFLPRVVGVDVVDSILGSSKEWSLGLPPPSDGACGRLLDPSLCFYGWSNKPWMPVEFSVAAYRFGHTMVRDAYVTKAADAQTGDGAIELFSGTGGDSLSGFKPRAAGRTIEWAAFFDLEGADTAQKARRIDARLSPSLARLFDAPGDEPSNRLAFRNLERGYLLQLPSGQAVAEAMGVPESVRLTRDQLLPGAGDDPTAQQLVEKLVQGCPLWLYILAEAEVLQEGARLGPVGGRIVAEVIIGLLWGDRHSVLRADPTFTPWPELGASDGPRLPAFTGVSVETTTFRWGNLVAGS